MTDIHQSATDNLTLSNACLPTNFHTFIIARPLRPCCMDQQRSLDAVEFTPWLPAGFAYAVDVRNTRL